MQHSNRGYGLMVGITMGFAVWGSVGQSAWSGTGEAVAAVSGPVNRNALHTALEVQTQSMAFTTAPVEAGAQQGALSLHALSAVLMDGDSGRILYAKEADTFRPMASTTKIMTCILALENGDLSDVCTASGEAASQPQVHLGVRTGQQFYLKDLLYSLMLESHNDAAVIIAEHIGGSVEGFAEMMNQKARDLGCADTCFVTPNGLDATCTAPDGTTRTHGTTAADLARVMRYCIRESPKREEFLTITRTANYSFTDTEGKRCYSCVNHNALLSMMEGALSGKTGFTGGAGYSYVGALEDDGRTFVLALLGCGWPPHKTWKWADARMLFQYGRERFHYRDVYQEPELSPVSVWDGIPGPGEKEAVVELTTGISDEEKHWNLLLAPEEQVEQQVRVPDYLNAPVEAGELVGSVEYALDGRTIRTDPLYAVSAVERKNFRYFAGLVVNCFFMEGVNPDFS